MTLKDALHLGHSRKGSVGSNGMTSSTSPATATRHDTVASNSSTASNEAIPRENGDVAITLEERLRAWKHLIANLQDYVEQTESIHKNLGKEYEKVVKTIAEPLRQSEMYTQSTGGVQSLFESLRANTTALAHSHIETEHTLKKNVVSQLEKLHAEIKGHQKQVTSRAAKGAKAVSKAREHTKHHIDSLAAHVGNFDAASGGGSSALKDPMEDPYIVKRGVIHRLYKQVGEENSHRQELLGVQNSFQGFEAHIIQTVQSAMSTFYQAVSAQADKTKSLYGDIGNAVQRVPPDFEWTAFVQRFGSVLIDPSQPNRDFKSITFANHDHKATAPLIEGALQRKGKIMKSYNNGYYVITPSKYLHEFKHDNKEDYQHDPEPVLSLYLPTCTLSALSPAPVGKFIVNGKDQNKNQTFTREHEFCFKAASYEEAKRWYDIVAGCVGIGNKTEEVPAASPVTTRENTFNSQADNVTPPAGQETGVVNSGAAKPIPA